MNLESGNTIIHQLRAHSNAPDPWTLESRLRGVLELPQPGRLGSNAILCIRRLLDPMPGKLRLNDDSFGSISGWQQAVHSKLEALASRALRPALESVPGDAEAVIFADRAELLACLSRDWFAARLNAWWWRSLASELRLNRPVPQIWLDSPELIPVALEHLALTGHVTEFAEHLSQVQALALMLAFTYQYGLFELQTIFKLETLISESEVSKPQNSRLPDLISPWSHLVREANDITLSPTARALIGLGLGFRRKPTLVRSASFAREFKIWWQALHSSDSKMQVTPQPKPPMLPRSLEPDLAKSELLPITKAAPPRQIAPQPALSSNATQSSEKLEAEQIASMKSQAEKPQKSHVQQPQKPKRLSKQKSIRSILKPPQPDFLPAPQAKPKPYFEPIPLMLETRVHTAFGGVLFLLNLALALDLYADFSQPNGGRLRLSPWDFLALIGQHVLGDVFVHDPIWRLLERLSGRDADVLPRTDFVPPKRWRVPRSWLQAFPEAGICDWDVDPFRLRVQHPAGFRLLDVPVGKNPVDQFRRIKRAYPRLEWQRSEILETPSQSSLERWLGWMLPYLQARLSLALGISPEETLAFVCCCPASITITQTQLEAYFSLETHPIQLRISGLDRDPGWIPAAGRSVRFHFETSPIPRMTG